MSSDAEVKVTRGPKEKRARVDSAVNGSHLQPGSQGAREPGVEIYSSLKLP